MAATADAVLLASGKAVAKRFKAAIDARRVQIVQASDSNALQSTGSYWAGLRNAMRLRGVPNWGSAPHATNNASFGAATAGATVNPPMYANDFGGYLRGSVSPAVMLPEDRASLPADIKKRVAVMKAETTWGGGGAEPTFAASGGGSTYTIDLDSYHGLVYGVHVNLAEDGVTDQACAASNGGSLFAQITPSGSSADNAESIVGATLNGGVWKLDHAIEFRGLYRRDTDGSFYAAMRGDTSAVVIDSISVPALGVDTEWQAYTLSAPAGTAITADASLGNINILPSYGTTITRKTFVMPGQFSRPDLLTGFACGCIWAEGGRSLGHFAHLLYWLSTRTGREYAIQDYFYRLVMQAGGDGDVCLMLKHKGNDYAQSTNSIDTAGVAGDANNTVTGYTTNLTTVCTIAYNAFEAMKTRYGLSTPKLYIVDGGYHPQFTGAAARNTYQQDCSNAAAALFEANPAWNAFAIDAQQYITPQEMFDGVGAGTLFKTAVSNEPHLSTEGYREMGEREWDSIVLAAAAAGGGGGVGPRLGRCTRIARVVRVG